MKNEIRLVLILTTLSVWVFPQVAYARNSNHVQREILAEWTRDGEKAAKTYLILWIQGRPPEKLALPAASLLAAETHIVTYCLGDSDCLRQYSILWGRSVDKSTLPIILMERLYRMDLSVAPLFGASSGRNSTLQVSSPPPASGEFGDRRHTNSEHPPRGIVWETIGTLITLPVDLVVGIVGLGDGILWPAQ